MKKDDCKETAASNLRRRAEKRFGETQAATGPRPKNEDTSKLIHELQVHQIELELQNEELMEARDEIETSLEKYSDLYDFAPVGYFTLTEDGMIREVNLTGAVLLGEDRSHLIRRRFGLFISDETRPAFFVFLKKVFERDTKETCVVVLENNSKNIRIEGRAIESHTNGRQCLMVANDITERKKAEEEKRSLENQLIQAQKMEALGRFAGGIAHDLNNLLYPIIVDTEYLLEETIPDSSFHQTLEQVLKAAYRQRDLVKQILSFSRHIEQRLTPMKVTPLMRETLTLLRSSLPSTIEIGQHIDISSDLILGDPTQIQQIIMNLCRNAADAIGSRTGTIDVSLTNTYLEPGPAHPDIKAGQFLKLMVKDTGHGMKKEVMEKIFEPFYTTKGIDKGSGMGLAVVHGILKHHGGAITVESEQGKGSQFSVYLPTTDEKIETQTPAVDKAQSAKGKGKVLLVDDEDIILASLQNVLKRMGYDVVALKDSLEAYGVFLKAPSDFDLVITDLTMPQITGIELASKLMDIRPDIPVILCTGFNDVIDEEKAKSMGIRELLLKPASTNELKTAISRALEGS